MHISSKKFIEEITITCSESERVETEDWLTNKGYVPEPDLQYMSNRSLFIARKSTTINFTTSITTGDSEIEAARLFIEENPNLFRVQHYECCPPKVIDSKIPGYCKTVVFRTYDIGKYLFVYIEERENKYTASGWSSGS